MAPPIPFQSWVQQVTVDEEYGGHALRLHQQGQAIGRGTRLLYVRFARDTHEVTIPMPRVTPTTSPLPPMQLSAQTLSAVLDGTHYERPSSGPVDEVEVLRR